MVAFFFAVNSSESEQNCALVQARARKKMVAPPLYGTPDGRTFMVALFLRFIAVNPSLRALSCRRKYQNGVVALFFVVNSNESEPEGALVQVKTSK